MAAGLSAAVALILSLVCLTGTALAAAPTNTTPPSIPNDAWVGETLQVTPGTWTGNPTLSYQWDGCNPSCAAISRSDRNQLHASRQGISATRSS